MRTSKSRLMMLGMLALVASVTVGLLSGNVADAKKKGKKKGKGGSVTVSKTTPTPIPASTEPSGTTPGTLGTAAVQLTVGKKAKGKVVSPDSVAVTYTVSGEPPSGGDPGALWNVILSLTAPNGRTVLLSQPGFNDQNATSVGPVTETANSPFGPCDVTSNGPPPSTSFCEQQGPDDTLTPPSYVGTEGNSGLAVLAGMRAKGTWTVRARDEDTTKAATLNSVSLRIPLKPAK